MGRIRVGCSGWQYASWRDRFYPKGLPERRRLEQTPPDFVFAAKASRFLTHMKRLIDIDDGSGRYYDGIAPLARSPKLGPVLRQLPERFKRDLPRLAGVLDRPPGGRHAFELRHPSWFEDDEALELLRRARVALCVGHHPELRDFAPRVAELAGDGYVYFNNDWEGFAVKNALRLRALLS